MKRFHALACWVTPVLTMLASSDPAKAQPQTFSCTFGDPCFKIDDSVATGTAISGIATNGKGVAGGTTGANGTGVYGSATGSNGTGIFGNATGTGLAVGVYG